MSDTPLTDAESLQMPMKADAESPSGWCCVVRAKFARGLERKNTQLRDDNARLREALRNCAIAASGGRVEQIAWIVESALAKTEDKL